MGKSSSSSSQSSSTQISTTNQDNRQFITNTESIAPELAAELTNLASESFDLAGGVARAGIDLGAQAVQANTLLARYTIGESLDFAGNAIDQLGEISFASSAAIGEVAEESIEAQTMLAQSVADKSLESQALVIDKLKDFFVEQTPQGQSLKVINTVAVVGVVSLILGVTFKK